MVEQTALKQLYVDNLRDLQSAENELVKCSQSWRGQAMS
jgi:hypothetical protein